MSGISIFNPFSNQYHAIQDFKKLTVTQKIVTIALTVLASFATAFIATAAVFRGLVGHFVQVQKTAKLNEKNNNPAPPEQKPQPGDKNEQPMHPVIPKTDAALGKPVPQPTFFHSVHPKPSPVVVHPVPSRGPVHPMIPLSKPAVAEGPDLLDDGVDLGEVPKTAAQRNQETFFKSIDQAARTYPNNYTTIAGDKVSIPNLIKQIYNQSSSIDDFRNRLQQVQQNGQLQSVAGSGFTAIAFIVKMAEIAPPLASLHTAEVPQLNPKKNASSQKAKVFDLNAHTRASIYQHAPTYAPTHTSKLFESISDHGGAANIVNRIMQANPGAICGVMICANSGLPCGQVGADGFAEEKTINVKTQEESIIANVLLTQFGDDKAKHKQFMDASFKGVWGMVDGPKGNSTKTHQGIDFTNATDASAYNQAYALNGCQLGVTTGTGTNKTLVPGIKNGVSLIFADSINANPGIGSPTGTMQRTLNQKAVNDYPFFRECVKTKLRASLDAMVAEGNTHAVVGRLSCGIYAPDKWKQDPTDINKDFNNILTEVLQEQVGPAGEARRSYFMEVIIPHIPRS